MSFYEGAKTRLKIGSKLLFHERDTTLNMARDFKEIATKDTDGAEVTPGKKSFSLTSSAYAKSGVVTTTHEDLKSISDAYNDGTLVDIALTDGESGHIIFSGKGYIESVSVKATNEEVVDFDFSIKGSGALTVGTNA